VHAPERRDLTVYVGRMERRQTQTHAAQLGIEQTRGLYCQTGEK
jgi:hypothetical protein